VQPCYLAAVLRLTALIASVGIASLGCNTIGPETCARPNSESPRPYRDGTVEGHSYRSAAWDGELLPFAGGAYYQIYHGLGRVPVGLAFYLSFERRGVAEASLAPAAGNQVEIKAIDDETVTVLNGTCADYYLLATAWTGGNEIAAGGGGAGGGQAGAAAGTTSWGAEAGDDEHIDDGVPSSFLDEPDGSISHDLALEGG